MTTRHLWTGLCAAATLLAGAGLAEAKLLGQKGYSSAGITIEPVEEVVEWDDDKLWVKWKVTNTTDQVILVDRNQIDARTADGKVLKRILPVTGKGSAYVLQPNKTETITMEYATPKDASVTIVLKGFFGLDTKRIAMADYAIKQGK